MGHLIDLESASTLPHRTRAVPGPVRRVTAAETTRRDLVLRWLPPSGGAPVSGYRVERTREGRVYECLGETDTEMFIVPAPGLRDPWFYRVTAFNNRGAGRAETVCFFERQRFRAPREHPQASRLMLVPVRPGLRVTVCEFVPGQGSPSSGWVTG